MELIKAYFPNLTESQLSQLSRLGELYQEWNQKINVISRKDIDHVFPHHILHSMAIAKVMHFVPGSEILDLGTGGGLPGIPLAILFPETRFLLVDGTRKKIGVVQAIIEDLGLTNVKARHIRAEYLKHKFDFVICRAVASLDKLAEWSMPLIKHKQQHAMPNGLLTLKGGDISKEAKALGRHAYVESFPLTDFFDEAYFEEKYVVYVQG
jgi:16S rRNA (guanine527-N7)-methyltransferase